MKISSSAINTKAGTLKGSTDSRLLTWLLAGQPEFFDSIVAKKEELNVQIIYTQIDRKKKGRPVFTDHYFNVNAGRYFYPASTVKFPVALLALQRLNELKNKGVDKYSIMITEAEGEVQAPVSFDSSSANGKPSVAQYIRKIFLVSDNDAFNRLYEFLGQEYINQQLHGMGYTDAQIIHRLSVVLNEEQNRHTNPVRFADTLDQTIYRQPAGQSKWIAAQRDTKLGTGYIRGNDLIGEPFDFSKKNQLILKDLHSIMRSVIFPESVSVHKRFNLTKDDYRFLYSYLSMYPRQSDFPVYDRNEYPDNYVKKFLFGNDTIADTGIRIFSKSGTAYGFLTDVAYVEDRRNKVDFFLSATIYCNSDGIFNDDQYDYDAVGYPFLQHLAKVIYEYELKRKK